MDFDQHIQLHFGDLTDNEKEMVHYIVNNRQEVVKYSIIELGEKLLSSKSSVLRLAKKLGFRGYTDLKYSLEESLVKVVIQPSDLVAGLRDEINKTFQYAQQIKIEYLLERIKNCNRLLLYATGFTQNNYTKELSNDLFLSGRPNSLISGETNFDMISETLDENDLVIITSLSGDTKSIQKTVEKLKIHGASICSVTAFGKNYLSQNSDYQLYYETSKIPSNVTNESVSMVGLNIILTILSRKYREFILFDE
ncbi:transcriptional regulator [Floricoccus tropicus]|uniref:Transcriptional regulator n=1 Tax=Floricoccus tropicus TaxID=1859473 RepID=A0A1E8GKR6_9LACT|nr:MurR/RpiR family transcriptional regulator [Floricoccus tropicus]OFI48546.1 transcriptional regulator [Floricoccus tropicus]